MSPIMIAMYFATTVIILFVFHAINVYIVSRKEKTLIVALGVPKFIGVILSVVFLSVFTVVYAASMLIQYKPYELNTQSKFVLVKRYGKEENETLKVNIDLDKDEMTYAYDTAYKEMIPNEYHAIVKEIIERTTKNDYNLNKLTKEELQEVFKKTTNTFEIRAMGDKTYYVRNVDDVDELENITKKRDLSKANRGLSRFLLLMGGLTVIMIIRSSLLARKVSKEQIY